MAIHVLTVLAYGQGDRVTSASLAGSVNTNPVIIRRLLLALQRAKLVETRKGAGFGSRLSRSPARINLREVYRAVEHPVLFAMPRGHPDYACPVGSCIETTLERIFTSAQESLERDLARTTLSDIVQTTKTRMVRQPIPRA